MIDKGREFEADIKALKQLKSKSKKNPGKHRLTYLKAQEALKDKYDVSLRQVQNWTNERAPWLRKKREDSGKERVIVPVKTKNMLHDAIESGKNKKQTLKLVINKTGEKISEYKATQILKDEAISEKNNIAAFGDDFKSFLEKYFQLDLIPTHKGLKLKFGKKSYIITKQDISDIQMILINAFNRYQYAVENKLKLDRNYLRRIRTWHIFEMLTTQTIERLDSKSFNSLTLAMQRLEIDPVKFNTPNFKTLEACLRELKPDITFDEIYEMLEKYGD